MSSGFPAGFDSDPLEPWRKELLDLTARNRLLHLRTTDRSINLLPLAAPGDIVLLETLSGGRSLLVEGRPLDESLAENHVKEFGGQPDAPDIPYTEDEFAETLQTTSADRVISALSPARTSHILLNLKRSAATARSEQGVNILFVAFGRLHWHEMGKDPATDLRQAPVVLMPVQIEEIGRTRSFRISAEDSLPEINETLAEKLISDFDIPIPFESNDLATITMDEIFGGLKAAIHGFPNWKIDRSVCLTLLQYPKIRMAKDLVDHRTLAIQHPADPGSHLPVHLA